MSRGSSAIGRYKTILEADPESLERILPRTRIDAESEKETAEAVSLTADDWEKLTQILKQQLDRLESPENKRLAISHVGEIYEVQLADPERAFRWWSQVLTHTPHVEEACVELERLARIRDDWQTLVQAYNTAVRRLPAEDQRRVRLKLAQVYLEKLDDPGAAQRVFEALLKVDREDLEVLDGLEQLHVRCRDWEPLVRVLRRRLEILQVAESLVGERAAVLLKIAHIYETKLLNLDLAVEVFRQVLQLDPSAGTAARALERLFTTQQRWSDLLALYEQLNTGADDAITVTNRLIRMAEICDEHLDDRERSRNLWWRVIDSQGNDPTLLAQLASRFEVMGRWRELTEVLLRHAPLEPDPGQRASLWARAGQILTDKLKDPHRAVECWQQVLKVDPEKIEALVALSELYGWLAAWDERLKLLRRLVQLGEEGRVDQKMVWRFWSEIAHTGREILQPELVIEAYQRLLSFDPADLEVLSAMEALLFIEGRWDECIQTLETQLLVVVTTEAKVATLQRVAQIWRDGLDNVEIAIHSFRRVLELDAANTEAHNSLRNLFRGEQRWDELVAQIFAWLEYITDSQLKLELLHEAAICWEENLIQPERSFTVWQAAFTHDRGNLETRANLERLATALDCWDQLLELYQEGVQATPEARIKVSLLITMARYLCTERGQYDRTVMILTEALQMDPESIGALEVLEECYRRGEQWGEMAAVLQRHIELEQRPARLIEILATLAQIHHLRLGDGQRTVATCQKILALEPAHAAALGLLRECYTADQQWGPLVDLLDRQITLTDDPAEVTALTFQRGEIYQHQLDDPGRAIAAYHQVLTVDPLHQPAMQALEELFDQSGESEAYLGIVERQLDLFGISADKIKMYPRIAAAWEEQFANPRRAIDCLEKMLDNDPHNEEVYGNLERLCRITGDDRMLAGAIQRHIEVVSDVDERIGLYLTLGQIRDTSMGDATGAAEAYREVLSLDPLQLEALDALAHLHQRLGHMKRAVEVMDRQVSLIGEASQQSEIYFRLGQISEEQLQLPERAEHYFSKAIQADPAHLEALARLIVLYQDQGRWFPVVDLMTQAATHTVNALKKTQLLYQAGMIALERLGEPLQAKQLLAQVLEIDPDHVQAGLPLARLYLDADQFELAETVLEMLLRKLASKEQTLRLEVSINLAQAAERQGKRDKAIRAYQEVRKLDINHLPTLRALSVLLFEVEDYQGAFKVFQTLLIHHRPEMSREEVVEAFHQLGEIKNRLSEQRKALGFFAKALEENPTHRLSLEAVIGLHSKANDWPAVVEAKMTLYNIAGAEEQYQILRQCGDIYRDRLNLPEEAISAYRRALTLRGDDRVLLYDLMELLTATRHWNEVVEVVLRLMEIEQSPERRAKFLYSAAVICRDELDDPRQAILLFNKTLDAAPDQLKAFEAIDRLCTREKNWEQLELNYLKMIDRLPSDVDAALSATLWHNLGEVYRSRLKRYEDAICSYEAALKIQPDHLLRQEILAELYQLSGSQHDRKAVETHQALIRRSLTRVESYHALYKLYTRIGERDKAWCVCRVLDLLNQAGVEEQTFFAVPRPLALHAIRGGVSDALWRQCIVHSDQAHHISLLLATVAPLLMELMARPAKEYGLKRGARIKPSADQTMVRVFGRVAELIGTVPTDIYLDRNQEVDLMVANTVGTPSVVVGARLLELEDEKQLAFILGRQLTYLRPEHILSRVFPTMTQLLTALLAAMKLADPSLRIRPADAVEVEKIAERLKEPMRRQPEVQEALADNLRQLSGVESTLHLGRWWSALGLTSNRVGLILSDDLQRLTQVIHLEPTLFGTLTAKEKAADLVLYSISEEYFEVRRDLGLTQ